MEFIIKDIEISVVALDEYREIEEFIFLPNISSDVRGFWAIHQKANKKLIKRMIKAKCNIMQAMGKRPPATFDKTILTIDYEKVMDKKEIEKKTRRYLMMKKAKQRNKDPIEMYQLKQRMEKMKLNRIEQNVQNKSDTPLQITRI